MLYITIIVLILVGHDLYHKKMKNDVKLKEIEFELRKLELEKLTVEEAEKIK